MMKKRKLELRDIIIIGILAAMCAAATTIKVPLGTGAMVHLGSAFLFTAGIAFGGVYAGLAGAIGSALFDLVMGASPYTLWSFVIKGMAGFIVGYLAHGVWPNSRVDTSIFPRAFLACLAAAAWTALGYFFAWWQVIGSMTVALANLPSSFLTSTMGLVVAMLISGKLRRIVKNVL